jgi:16S rRNA (guanine527-N7)-methyltransferase
VPETPREILVSGLEKQAIVYAPEQVDALIQFIELIKQWNRIDNLTAVDDLSQMVSRHLLDSLTLLPYLKTSMLDVGSGAGLPGIPLAIMQPECKITLLDASAKRVRFLHQAISTLKLKQVTAVHARVERFPADEGFDLITSRAFSSLQEFVSSSQRLLAPRGRIIAMKGKYPEQELAALNQQLQYTVEPINLPGLDAERHLVTITPL